MEEVCIVCSCAIAWSTEETADTNAQAHASASSAPTDGASPPTSAGMQRGYPSNRSSANPGVNGDGATAKANSDKQQQQQGAQIAKRPAHHQHAVRGHHHVRVKRTQSHGKLPPKSGIKPLASTASSAAIASNPAAVSAAGDAGISNAVTQEGQLASSTAGASDAITSENLPDWMAIYCSEECRNEDELRSRLAFANLNEERERSITKVAALQTQSSVRGVGDGRAHSNSSLSPTFAPPGTTDRSPWCNVSEGSEFDWHSKEKDIHRYGPAHAHPSDISRHRATSSRDGSDIITPLESEGRRFSDASDSSRLSNMRHRYHGHTAPTLQQHPHARKGSSRTRGSNDSLDSLGSSTCDYSSSGGVGHQLSRPDVGHRSTSALGGLRAMTPIHHQHQPTPAPASPRMASPGRIGSSPKIHQSSANPTATASSKGSTLLSSGTTASVLIGSKTSAKTSSSVINGDHIFSGPSSESTTNLGSSTCIAPSSAKTFRPESISKAANGGGFLKTSKSSATLALSAGDDVRATMAPERTSMHGTTRRPPNAMSRGNSHHHHRYSHHTSTSSIPYLSCSPSSPGSGSMYSGRSNISTDPSSSSMRGEGEYRDDYEECDTSDDGEYIPLPRKSEDDERNGGSTLLASYGLFYQRTPSTPSLPSLARQHSSFYGRSPPVGPHSFGASRASRLSASLDIKNYDKSTDTGSTTISSIFRERQANSRPGLRKSHSHSSRQTPSNDMNSPKRANFGVNPTCYQAAPMRNHSFDKLHPPSRSSHHQAGSTPTQSGLASRSHSFAGHYTRMAEEPTYGVFQDFAKDQYGRTRAPSISRTDLERVGSDRSLTSTAWKVQPSGVETSRSSTSTLQQRPSHLRRAALSPRTSQDLTLPPPPISPGLYNANLRDVPHHAMHQLYDDPSNSAYGRPLLASARTKSRSSFTWDHLPPYIPQYAALDLNKVRRNISGTSLHSVSEEDTEGALSPAPSSSQSTVKAIQHHQPRKRLFYFPEAE